MEQLDSTLQKLIDRVRRADNKTFAAYVAHLMTYLRTTYATSPVLKRYEEDRQRWSHWPGENLGIGPSWWKIPDDPKDLQSLAYDIYRTVEETKDDGSGLAYQLFANAHINDNIFRLNDVFLENLIDVIEEIRVQSEGLVDLDPVLEGPPRDDFRDLSKRRGFVRDSRLVSVLDRDQEELSEAVSKGLWKAVVLLCGSMLEAVLLDVLDRRPDVAETHLKKGKWPEDASLKDLIGIADKHGLVGETTRGMSFAITEHRDLIHPHAEIRKEMLVDKETAAAMVQLLRLVLRDLDRAEKRGTIAGYENL